jgi:hypothetical protein
MIRIEFWNGQLDKKGNLVKTKHNPCLWTNINEISKPWRSSYKEALQAISKYFNGELSDEDFLHHIRYVAYGIGKRDFDDKEVVWWGNMTELHKPKLVVENFDEKYTINFYYESSEWKVKIEKDTVDFYWPL